MVLVLNSNVDTYHSVNLYWNYKIRILRKVFELLFVRLLPTSRLNMVSIR